MKPIEPLIEGFQEVLLAIPEVESMIGSFSNSDNPEYTPRAIAYNSLPEAYTVPTADKVFIIYTLEGISPKTREGKSFLQTISLKLYIGGYDAHKIADILIGQLDNSRHYTYIISYAGVLQMPNGDITVRFNLI